MEWLREQMRDRLNGSPSSRSSEQVPGFDRQPPVPGRNEGAVAVDLVNQAAEMIRNIEQRAAGTAARAETIAKRALEALERAEERISQIEGELGAAEERAKVAETQAREAKAALIAVENAIRTQFFKGRTETSNNLAAAA